MSRPTAQQIDALLPQTQCGLCTYKGCMPYAEALAQNQAPINLCPPGGIPGLLALANILNQDATPYLNEMQQKTKPTRVAVIREAECIGCTKCITACPVDAILGSGKLMHTVMTDECTGCELCIEPCPVDCIDMISIDRADDDTQRNYYRERYLAREQRLQTQSTSIEPPTASNNITEKQAYIQAAVQRAKEGKKLKK